MDAIRSLVGQGRPSVRMGTIQTSASGMASIAGLGTGSPTDSTPTGSSSNVSPGSAAIILCPGGNPQLWTAIGTSGWNLPPI